MVFGKVGECDTNLKGWIMGKSDVSMWQRILPLLFCCQLSTLGLLRQTPSYSWWEAEIYSYPELSLWIARIFSVIVVIAAVGLFVRGKSLLYSKKLLFLNSFMLIVGFAITFYASYTLPLYIFGQTLIGISHAWILVSWAELFLSMSRYQRNFSIAVSGLLASLLFALIGVVPVSIRSIMYLAIAIGSVLPVIYFGLIRDDTQKAEIKKTSLTESIKIGFNALTWELVLIMTCYALVFRILTLFDLTSSYGSSVFAWGSTIRIIGMLALLAYLAVKKFEPNIRQMIVTLFFLTVIGLTLLPGTDGHLGAFSIALIESSWTFFYTLIWLILFEIATLTKRNGKVVFALGWGTLNTMLLVAVPIAYQFKVQVSAGVLSLTALCLVVVYTLLIGLLLFGRKSKEWAKTETSQITEGDWKQNQEKLLESIAQESSLTKRETEVFILLAQGYSLPAIEEEFFLSHSTIKGHARSIYKKLGVNNKQELIKLINSKQ